MTLERMQSQAVNYRWLHFKSFLGSDSRVLAQSVHHRQGQKNRFVLTAEPPPPSSFFSNWIWFPNSRWLAFSFSDVFVYFLCLSVFSCIAPCVSQRSEGGARSSGAGGMNGYGPLCGCSHLTPILCKHTSTLNHHPHLSSTPSSVFNLVDPSCKFAWK